MPDALDHRALARTCSTCGEPPGAWCMTGNGKRASTLHFDRLSGVPTKRGQTRVRRPRA